jgi:hypothetical protein
VLVTERVGENERVEAVVLHGRDPIALASPSRDTWRNREHHMPLSLKMLDE